MNNYLLLLLLLLNKNKGGEQNKNRNVSKVPNVIGKSLEEAEKVIKEKHLIPKVLESVFIEESKKGEIVDQIPKVGLAEFGDVINLIVSLGDPDMPGSDSESHQQLAKKIEESTNIILQALQPKDIQVKSVGVTVDTTKNGK